jgi:hypothetical protein
VAYFADAGEDEAASVAVKKIKKSKKAESSDESEDMPSSELTQMCTCNTIV